MLLNFNWSYVYYCKAKPEDINDTTNLAKCQQIKSENINSLMNNGIAYVEKDNMLYIARTRNKSVGVFKIGKDNKAELNHIKEIALKNNPDNLEYDHATNSITIGVSGSPSDTNNYIAKTIKREFNFGHSTCWGGADIINLDNNCTDEVVSVYDRLCGYSSAVRVGKKMFMGSWGFNGVLVCDV